LTVGSVIAVESPVVLGLALGGALGAPIGAWACRHVPVKPFMILVGLVVIALSGRTLWRIFA
jgi:uncharacterized membrane protein YfcA